MKTVGDVGFLDPMLEVVAVCLEDFETLLVERSALRRENADLKQAAVAGHAHPSGELPQL